MKALITGGAGNLGRRVVQLLRDSGDEARIFDLPQVDYSYFDGMSGVDIVKGDIRDEETVRRAVESVDAILHLAALIPPQANQNRERTFAINVGGTKNLISAAAGREVHFVLASSVSTYGDTSNEKPPVKETHPQVALDIYGESKVASEKAIMDSGLAYTILRIAPISIPEPMDPPDMWPYRPTARVEFVNRDDVADAVFGATRTPQARNRIFNIGGGRSWQLTGREYVGALCDAMDIEDEQQFSDNPHWFDWYDTGEAQAVLKYQNTPFPMFVGKLRQATAEAMGW